MCVFGMGEGGGGYHVDFCLVENDLFHSVMFGNICGVLGHSKHIFHFVLCRLGLLH